MSFAGKPFVLAVDDSLQALAICEEYLEEHYRVYTVASAKLMFEALEVIKPDIILLDVMMPEIDGYEAARALKSDSRYCDIPIIFLTGATDESSESEGFAVGAVDYIHKPFNKISLLHRVETQLSLRRHMHEVRELKIWLTKIKKSSGVVDEDEN